MFLPFVKKELFESVKCRTLGGGLFRIFLLDVIMALIKKNAKIDIFQT